MKTLSYLILSVLILSQSPAAHAGFRKEHPRRAEVNGRIRHQERRINHGVKNGTLTPAEAKADRQQLRNLKKEERAMVKGNGGHLTKAQGKELNQDLNQNSKEIYNEKHD